MKSTELATTFQKRLDESRTRLGLLVDYLEKKAVRKDLTWADAGDLGHINEKLRELMVFIGAETEGE